MKVPGFLSALLIIGELLLIMVSWLLAATMGDSVRSLLSGEGIRWLLGSFVDTVQTPLLVWLLLLAMAYGCLKGSGCLGRRPSLFTRQSSSPLRGALLLLLLFVVVVVILVAAPSGVLLSATGRLWPSPLSSALLPLLALATIVFATAYGILSRTFTSFSAIIESLANGVALAAPLFVVYVLFVQFIASLSFVFAGTGLSVFR